MRKRYLHKTIFGIFLTAVFLCAICMESKASEQAALSVNVMTTTFANESNQTVKNYQCPYTTIVPVKCSVKGVMNMSITISKGSAKSVELYQDQACTKLLASTAQGSGKKYDIQELLTAGTYYLQVVPYGADTAFRVCASQYSVQNTVMKEGKWTVASTAESNNISASPYHKITVKKKGYIIVNGNQSLGSKYAVSLRLCNSKKQPVSSDYTYTVNSHYTGAYFAVTPGTYYLQSTILYGRTPYRIKYTFKSAPKVKNITKAKGNLPAYEISKTARKKAVSLKKNKKTPLVYYTKDSSMKYHRWYKIKITKKQKITVYMDTTWTSPHIFDSKGKRVQTQTYDLGCRTVKKVKAGTYYIEAPACFEKLSKNNIGLVRMLYWK